MLIPDNEAQRLESLREYRILDTAPEQAYDDITALAAYLCDVPIATISLVDESRQWFKSKRGLKQRETPREVAFCAHVILQSKPLIVRDALKDARFAENALVTRSPHIRFYAGFPLTSPEGFALGTLCAMDREPRQLSAEQKRVMQALSQQVMALLELRRVSARMPVSRRLDARPCCCGPKPLGRNVPASLRFRRVRPMRSGNPSRNSPIVNGPASPSSRIGCSRLRHARSRGCHGHSRIGYKFAHWVGRRSSKALVYFPV
jgi:hypothetical protein